MDKISPNAKLTTVSIRISLPTDEFTLYSLNYDPLSLQAELALEYKAQYYTALEYAVDCVNKEKDLLSVKPQSLINNSDKDSKQEDKLEVSIESFKANFPYLKYENDSFDEIIWLNQIDEIYKLLDDAYTKEQILQPKESKVKIQNTLFTNWFNTELLPIYYILLLLSNEDLLANDSTNNLTKSLVKAFKKRKLQEIDIAFQTRDEAYDYACEKFKNECLPFLLDILKRTKTKYLFGKQPYTADFALYSYLKLFNKLVEADMLRKHDEIYKYIEAIESYPLSQNKSQIKESKAKKAKIAIQ